MPDLKTYYSNVIKKNPLYLNHQFVVEFQGRNEFGATSFFAGTDPKSFTYNVKSSSVPEVTMGEQTVNFLGQDFVLPKVVTYGGTWDVTIFALNSLQQYLDLRTWCEHFADIRYNGGGDKKIPSTDAHVKLLDSKMENITKEFVLVGIYPTKVPDMSMQYESAANIPDLQITFTYQYMYNLGIEDDPVQA